MDSSQPRIDFVTKAQLSNEDFQTRIQNQALNSKRINEEYKIKVNREIVVNNGPANHQLTLNDIGTSQVNHAISQKLQSINNPKLRETVKQLIGEGNSEINFNNFDIAYSKIVQAIKEIESIQ